MIGSVRGDVQPDRVLDEVKSRRGVVAHLLNEREIDVAFRRFGIVQSFASLRQNNSLSDRSDRRLEIHLRLLSSSFDVLKETLLQLWSIHLPIRLAHVGQHLLRSVVVVDLGRDGGMKLMVDDSETVRFRRQGRVDRSVDLLVHSQRIRYCFLSEVEISFVKC